MIENLGFTLNLLCFEQQTPVFPRKSPPKKISSVKMATNYKFVTNMNLTANQATFF